MKVVLDLETDGLEYTKIWVACAIDVATGKEYVFREPWRDYKHLRDFLAKVEVAIGHNFLGFDYLVLSDLVSGHGLEPSRIIDTLVVSKITNFKREGRHSLDAWGKRVGIQKPSHDDWLQFSEDMVVRCLQDCRINLRVYEHLSSFIHSPLWAEALRTEHDIQLVCNEIHRNGFHFDILKAKSLYQKLEDKLSTLDNQLKESFRPKTYLIKEVTPVGTLHGTLHKKDFRFLGKNPVLDGYSIGSSFSLFGWEEFNPSSPKQIVERLNVAGWRPFEKTKGHEEAVRTRNKIKLQHYKTYGWQISENNLSTLPKDAPEATRKLAERLILASRTRRLDEWFNAYTASSGRIHGTVTGLGTWTHRMAHSDPNLGNIPTEKPQDTEEVLEINRIMRECFCVPDDCWLVGVDADQIQLRVLSHYMPEEKEFMNALVNGDKAKATDVHSLNVGAIGPACKGRRDAKTFIYAWLLGAGIGRVQEILDCTREEAASARDRFGNYYSGLARLKKEDIPRDARLGYIKGLDNRFIPCDDEHRILAVYLQSGEAIIMKRACLLWRARLLKEHIPFKLVNFVHDEWQTEVKGDLDVAKYVAHVQAESIRIAGEQLETRCPMKGSIYGGHDQLAIGKNWFTTH